MAIQPASKALTPSTAITRMARERMLFRAKRDATLHKRASSNSSDYRCGDYAARLNARAVRHSRVACGVNA